MPGLHPRHVREKTPSSHLTNRYMPQDSLVYGDIGIIFVSSIIGLSPSVISAFDVLKAKGVAIEGVDIFEGQNIEKGFWKILGLTALPGSHARRVKFANNFDENRLFEIISARIEKLKNQGKKNIILGGM